MMRRLLLLMLMSVLLPPASMMAQEAYAVFTDDGTLSFYYDNHKDLREDVVYEATLLF